MLNEIIDTKKTKKNDVMSTAKRALLMSGFFMLGLSVVQLNVSAMTASVELVASKVSTPKNCDEKNKDFCCDPNDPTEDYCCDRVDQKFDWKNPDNQQYAEQGCRDRDIGRPSLERDTSPRETPSTPSTPSRPQRPT